VGVMPGELPFDHMRTGSSEEHSACDEYDTCKPIRSQKEENAEQERYS
jgi:hypothetical protein